MPLEAERVAEPSDHARRVAIAEAGDHRAAHLRPPCLPSSKSTIRRPGSWADNASRVAGDLRAEGLTDYLVLPVPFSDGTIKAVSFATDRPQRFTDTAIGGLQALISPLSMILEIQTLQR